MKSLFLLVVLFLTGCSASVDQESFDSAVKACENNDGLYDVTLNPLVNKMTVLCKNKFKKDLPRIRIKNQE